MSRGRDYDDYDDRDRDRGGYDDYGGGRAPKSGAVTAVGIITIVLGSIVIIFGLCTVIGGLFVAGAAADLDRFGGPPGARGAASAAGALVIIMAILMLGAGIFGIFAGIGVIQRKGWARIGTLVLGGFSALGAILSLVGVINTMSLPAGWPGKTGSILIGLLFVFLYIGYTVLVYVILLSSKASREFA